NAISLMFFPIFVLYAVFLYVTKKKSREFLLQTVLVFLSGFFLSAFFLGPAFFEGKYTLRDIVTKNEYMNRFETIERFFFGKWNYGGTGQFSVQIGIVQWIAVGLTPLGLFIYRKQKNALWLLCAGSFVLFFTTLFLMTKPSLPLWEVVTILQKFQFPWRLLSVSVFLSGLMVALVVDALKGRISSVLIIVLVAFLFFVNMGFWYPKGYIKNPDIFYSGIYNGTTDTGESAPIWSVRFMEHRAGTSSSVIEGRAEIAQITRSSTRHQYKISADVPSRILENTLYFPGWNVSVNGTNVPLEFQDPRFRGLITYFIPKGESNVQVVFSETKLRLVADFISLGTFVLLLGYAVYLMTQRLWRNSR
ncbi:MAG: hypothetical protein Q8Q49_05950, partial [bacterium]|nr:hypothetical protein [bacterium]